MVLDRWHFIEVYQLEHRSAKFNYVLQNDCLVLNPSSTQINVVGKIFNGQDYKKHEYSLNRFDYAF